MFTVRISLPGKDALVSTDPRDFSLFADQDNVLIKEHSRGAGSLANGDSATITHSLGYIPHYFAYIQVASGR